MVVLELNDDPLDMLDKPDEANEVESPMSKSKASALPPPASAIICGLRGLLEALA